jgi:DNA polymerase-1
VAEKGFVFLALDYSQIEMRVLAALADDEIMIETFRTGKDIHGAVASHVFGVPESEVTKDQRRHAKAINFGIVYGMGITALQQALGGTRAEAEEFHSNYFIKFPKILNYLENIKRSASKNGYTETFFGRRRYFPGFSSHIPYVRAMAERMAMNAPLQGTAADIVKLAMIKVDTAISEKKMENEIRMLLQVHDELIFEVREDAAEKAIPLLKQAMEHACEFAVPLLVEVARGEKWGEMKRLV